MWKKNLRPFVALKLRGKIIFERVHVQSCTDEAHVSRWYYTPSLRCFGHSVRGDNGYHSQLFCKARVPCGHLSTLPHDSGHVWHGCVGVHMRHVTTWDSSHPTHVIRQRIHTCVESHGARVLKRPETTDLKSLPASHTDDNCHTFNWTENQLLIPHTFLSTDSVTNLLPAVSTIWSYYLRFSLFYNPTLAFGSISREASFTRANKWANYIYTYGVYAAIMPTLFAFINVWKFIR
jgi:hypothetical protein